MRSVCIIPARMGSSRFPGKPLQKILGLPMILHLYERCRLFKGFERVVVATCDSEIFELIEDYGGEVVMTAETHERCTDRTYEAVKVLELDLKSSDFVLMVQGDEILVSPRMLEKMVNTFAQKQAPAINVVSRLTDSVSHDDPNTVKVVANSEGRAIYLSRAPIPSRSRSDLVPMYQQTGIIGFSAAFLKKFGELEPTPLEIVESIDMLRVIEHNLTLNLVFIDSETVGVDTKADLKRAESLLRSDSFIKQYLASAQEKFSHL